MTIPQRYPTKVADRALAAIDGCFTPIIQMEMVFDHRLDASRLAKAMALTMAAEPLLGCRFVPRKLRPYWEAVETEGIDLCVSTDRAAEYEAYKCKGIDFVSAPQICACLYRSDTEDRLLIKLSHVVCDAAGVKDVVAILSTLYNRLEHDPEYRPDPSPVDFRGFWQVARQIPWPAHPKIVCNYLTEMVASLLPYRSHSLRLRPSSSDSGRYLTRHIETDAFANLSNYAKQRGATINDMLLAAIFRAQSKLGVGDQKAALRIAMTIDLRRYLPDGDSASLANFSAIEIITYGSAVDADFGATLARVVDMLNKRKSSWLGLSSFISTYPGIWALPFFALTMAVQKGFASKVDSSNSFDWFTNMAQIPREAVNFGGYPARAWLLPPGCNYPVLFFGCSGYNNTLSLSAYVRTDEERHNELISRRFLASVISELPLSRHRGRQADPVSGDGASNTSKGECT